MTDKQIKKYCDGLDCAICNEKEPCIYKIANELEEKLSAKEQECERFKEYFETAKEASNYNLKALGEMTEWADKLETALQEIKDIAEENDELLQGYHKEWANNKIILEKISEVENDFWRRYWKI